MKKLVIIILSALVVGACEIHTSNNGNLDGFWHCTRVDTLSTQGHADLSEQRLYWAFQSSLLLLTDYDGPSARLIAHFDYDKSESQLTVKDFHYYDREKGDPALPDSSLSQLKAWFEMDTVTTFRVEQLTSSRLTIASSRLRIAFEKQ